MRPNFLLTFVFILTFFCFPKGILACTSILVTKGASADGSVIITYSCDGEFHPLLRYQPAQYYSPEDSLEIKSWTGEVMGKIAQVRHTYACVGLMNEHQLVIGETTFDGREELQNPEGLLPYWQLMQLALQRAKTAREAIQVMVTLVEEYGYRSSGESFSIADPEEAWILEMIGPGKGGQGAIWVAVKVPDGYISVHANKARIGEFPLNDPENCLYSANVISFAIDKDYYDPRAGQQFNFAETYCPSTPKNRRFADTRVWSIFRRAAPSINWSPDYHRSVENAQPYPLCIKPDKKLNVADVFSLMRDHYEGTEFDMTKENAAGPFGSPNRWRPLIWQIDSVEYAWERPLSTQQTGYSFVSQSRSWLPNPIGGLLWYGVDDTYTSCYIPLYCGIESVPEAFATGNLRKFSWDSAWWIFNFVANFANLKYSYMIQDIKAVQYAAESNLLALQPAMESTAVAIYKSNPALAKHYLTEYASNQTDFMVKTWKELAEFLITKYNDGYVQDEKSRPQEKGYPEAWLRKIIETQSEQFKLKPNIDKTPESRLVD